MKWFKHKLYRLAANHSLACKDNAAFCVILTFGMLFFVNLIESQLEELIFGEAFLHWIDPVIWISGFAYSAFVTRVCAMRNAVKEGGYCDES